MYLPTRVPEGTVGYFICYCDQSCDINEPNFDYVLRDVLGLPSEK